jgi:hypothetical protein
MEARDKILHLGRRPLDPLKENATAEDQNSGDAASEIVPLGRLDDTVNLRVIDAIGGTAAVDEVIQSGQIAFVQLSASEKAVFVQHGWTLSRDARRAVLPSMRMEG